MQIKTTGMSTADSPGSQNQLSLITSGVTRMWSPGDSATVAGRRVDISATSFENQKLHIPYVPEFYF